jgi:hypothetical protein
LYDFGGWSQGGGGGRFSNSFSTFRTIIIGLDADTDVSGVIPGALTRFVCTTRS